jgi:hypothetical protein
VLLGGSRAEPRMDDRAAKSQPIRKEPCGGWW